MDKLGNVCKIKSDGRRRVKHLERFNNAILRKWMWRMLSEPEDISSKGVRNNYGGQT